MWLDTSVFTTALCNHNASEACRELLRRVDRGEVLAVLDPVVLGELAYMLIKPFLAERDRPPRTRQEVAHFLLGVIAWPGIQMEDKFLAAAALDAWKAGHADDFVDCYLQARASAAGDRVCTVNLKHFSDEAAHPADLVDMARPGRPQQAPKRKR